MITPLAAANDNFTAFEDGLQALELWLGLLWLLGAHSSTPGPMPLAAGGSGEFPGKDSALFTC